ncbi:MAG: M14 family zinc carboxypeptidase [Clostridium sp.]
MISSEKFYHLIKKATFIKYMTFSLAASCVFSSTAFTSLVFAGPAGPADDTALTVPQIGPGQTPGQGTEQVPPTQAAYANPNYYDLGLQNPVVHPTDKYTYEQMEQDMTLMAGRYGNHMIIQSIGQSLDGRNLYDVIVGNPNAPKQILIQGAIHGREYITVPLMMQQLEYLLAHYDTGYFRGKTLSSMLSNTAIHFVPMSNPDGVSISQFGEGALRSPDLRQMVQACYAMDVAEGRTGYSYDQYLRLWKSNGRGVDLNHNFDASWALLNPNLTHGSATDFKGSNPLSEPEALALNNLTTQHSFATVINYHAMGSVIYWNTADNKLAAPSLDMAQQVSAENGYRVLGSLGVGGFKDWLQKRDKPIAGITIEVGRSACPVSFSEYPAIWEQNKSVPGLMIDYVLTH